MNTRKRTTRLRRHSLTLGILMGLSVPLSAQEPVEATAVAMDAAQETVGETETQADPVELEKMIVTGSRIRRAGFDTLEPATVLDRTYIDNRGLTNVADALNEMPSFLGSVTPQGNQGFFLVGVNFANRFGLGDNRTLTLINGRRFVSGNIPALFGAEPGLQVDLNTIPVAMIERVENLSIGGAPTYGSDAIAGVVNVILRRDFEGVAAGMGYGVTERGDNQRFNAFSTIGANFDDGRGNVTFSLNYDQVDGVLSRDREWMAAAYSQARNPMIGYQDPFNPDRTPGIDGRVNPDIPYNGGPNDGVPDNITIRDHRIWGITKGGLFQPALLFGDPANNRPVRFDANGNLVQHDTGYVFDGLNASGGDGLSLTDLRQVTSDLKRMTFNTSGRWGLTDSTDVFFEGLLYSGEARELADQSTYNAFFFSGRSMGIVLPTDYAMLTPQARDALAAYNLPFFLLERASSDLADQSSASTTDLARMVVGLEGDFEKGERIFYWEASLNYGRSTHNAFSTHLDHQKFVNAMHVVRDGSGNLTCSPTPVPGVVIPDDERGVFDPSWGWYVATPVADPNCVPLDILGEGRASAAARDYVTDRTRTTGVTEQQVLNANISSVLFDLWSGELSYNVGIEHRRESASFIPDAFQQEGRGRTVAVSPLNGEYKTNEAFAEFVMPLVNPADDLPMLKRFDVTGKFRYVDNSINGAFNTYTYGFQWKPIDDLQIRSNFTRSLRAPALMELYLPANTEYQLLYGDPCDVSNIDNAGSTRQINCQAFLDYYGLDEFQSSGASFSRPGVARGNSELRNEAADSYTYGFSWAPSFIPGFSMTADYLNIDISDVISRLSVSSAAEACFDNPEFNAADVPNANEFCSLVTRDANGQFQTFTSTYVNGASRRSESYTLDMRYAFDTDRFGNFVLGLNGYFPQEYTQQLVGAPEVQYNGLIGFPKQSYLATAEWNGGNWGTNLSAVYKSSVKFDLDAGPEDMDYNEVDDHWTLNAGVKYRFNDHANLQLAVSNLLDDEPPFPLAGQGTYDTLGRRYQVSFEWKY